MTTLPPAPPPDNPGDGAPPPQSHAWPTQARTPGDIRRPYLIACDNWEEANRRYHRASIAVAAGTGTTEQLAEAHARLDDALGRVAATRYDMAEVLFAGLRVIESDPHLKYALLLRLLNVLEPVFTPVADRLIDLEDVVARGAAA